MSDCASVRKRAASDMFTEKRATPVLFQDELRQKFERWLGLTNLGQLRRTLQKRFHAMKNWIAFGGERAP